jgi:hypothetical protein
MPNLIYLKFKGDNCQKSSDHDKIPTYIFVVGGRRGA